MISCFLSNPFNSNHNSLLFLLLINTLIKVTKSITNIEAEKYLQLGKECLSRGQLQEALTKFHSAIQADESNYLSYYHRGTTYLAMSSPKKAINDFQKVIDLQPEFHAVRLTRIEVFLKLGDIHNALQDIAFLEHSMMYLNEISEFKAKIEQINDYKMQADTLYEYENYESVIHLLEQIITLCPYDTATYSLKAKCHLQLGNTRGAIDSLKRVTILDANDYDSYFTIANLYYEIGDWQNALIEVRKCAQEDVHANCYQFYKKLRKLAKMFEKSHQAKSTHDYDLCIRKMDDLIREIKPLPLMIEFEAKKLQASCYLLSNDYVATLKKCDEALEIAKDPDLYCDKAEAYMNINHFDDAVQSFNEALNLNRDFERAQHGKEQALKRKKQVGKRDYYKILGVSRNANDDEIKSAYRALAKKWHPDKHKGDSKKTAEKKFRDAADAKEVLLNKEKRKLFDSGNDPLDPEQQSQHHHFHGSPEDIFRMFNQHAGGARDGGNGGNQGFRFSFRF